MNLDELEIGKDAVVASVDCDEPSLRQHILDMGLTPGVEVTLMKRAPMGDPLEIRLRGYELTLRRDDAAHIALTQVHDMHDAPRGRERLEAAVHPAIGERYAPRAAGKRAAAKPAPGTKQREARGPAAGKAEQTP